MVHSLTYAWYGHIVGDVGRSVPGKEPERKIMILKKEQIEKRLSSTSNITNPLYSSEKPEVEVIIKDGINNHTGKVGSKNLSEDEKIAIGVIASITDSRTAAGLFGIHPSHANDLKNGNLNSGVNTRIRDIELQEKIRERVENTKLTIQERAAEKLLESMGLLSNDKLEKCSAKDLANVSNQMAQVFRNMNSSSSPTNMKDSPSKINIVLHQPRPAKESSFDVIEIGLEN